MFRTLIGKKKMKKQKHNIFLDVFGIEKDGIVTSWHCHFWQWLAAIAIIYGAFAIFGSVLYSIAIIALVIGTFTYAIDYFVNKDLEPENSDDA